MTSTPLKNLILTLLIILAVSLGAAKAYIDHQLRKQLDAWKYSIADSLQIDYAEVKTSLAGAVIIKDSQLTTNLFGPVQIETITLKQAYQFYFYPLPPHILINLQGVHIPMNDITPPIPVWIKALGYAPYYVSPKELRAWGYPDIHADIDLETKLSHDTLEFSGKVNASWGKQTLQINLKNVPTLAKWPTLAGQMQLTQLTYNYTEGGFINTILTKLAQRNSMSLDNFKQTLIDKIRRDLAQAQIVLEASYQANWQQFIQQPHTLTVQLQPNPPVAVNMLWNVSPKRLGLKILGTDKN